MTDFDFAAPGRVLFGRGRAAMLPGLCQGLGARALLVRGKSSTFGRDAAAMLRDTGLGVSELIASGEPDIASVEGAVAAGRAAEADLVVAIGGGSVIDLGKAAAALIPADGDWMRHLEVVGQGAPLDAAPLPLVALPTTSGTGAEATRNAVIGVPEAGRKVSLRDTRMLPDIALVDPALTDGSPWPVTLGPGLDAFVQLVEAWLSTKATPWTDGLVAPLIPTVLPALETLHRREDPAARDAMSLASLSSGVALANGGLGAAHGLAGVLGGRLGAPHGALCGRLMGPVLRTNRAAGGKVADRVAQVEAWVQDALGKPLDDWADEAGLPRLAVMGLRPDDRVDIAQAAQASSSMKGNPVALSVETLTGILDEAS